MKVEGIQQLTTENGQLKKLLFLKDEQLLLKEQLLESQKQVLEEQKQVLEHQKQQLQTKNERILYLERQLYGRRSEKQLPDYSQAQLSLFDDMSGECLLPEERAQAESLMEEIRRKARQRIKSQKQKAAAEKRTYRIPSHLDRRETILEPEDLNRETMVKIGEDVNERLMLEPSKFWVERVVRPLYKTVENKDSLSTHILQAPKKETILAGCMAGESLLSQLVVDKFLYHLPEYRQAKRFKDLGLEISTSSINRWIHTLADKLYPLYLTQIDKVLSEDYIQMDETTLPIADHPGKTRKAYLWAVRSTGTPGIFFHYEKGSRSQQVVLKMLKDFKGALQRDGYAAYSIYENKQGVLLLGCLAHVRRKFENALTHSPQAQKALDYIALLYMLEGNLKEEQADHETIPREREEKAYPILQQMEQWMKDTYNQLTPKSPLAKAISYAFGMWPRISRYCKEGRFLIDNNAIENAIRPIALGRKNYLFSANDKGAEDNCLFYTLLGSCLQANVNPQHWLSETLEKIPLLTTPINWEKLLPANFSQKIK